MSWVDVVLVVMLAGAAWGGYRQGFITSAFGTIGFLSGGVVAVAVLPRLLHSMDSGLSLAVVATFGVLIAALLGQALLAGVGRWVSDKITWAPARALDSAGGVVLDVAAFVVVLWVLASSIVLVPVPTLSSAISNSKVLGVVDGAMPEIARNAFGAFRQALDRSGFPQAVAALGGPQAPQVSAPDPAVLAYPGVRKALVSLVKVTGVAPSCSKGLEGSGFVVAPERVVTNAHVVAGVTNPRIQVQGVGREFPATVVVFDPNIDIAVLEVPGLTAPALSFAPSVEQGSDAVVAGFPQDGPLTVVAARVRGDLRAQGRDIYDSASITREMYALRTRVLPGNSGGPMLTPQGTVAGVIFAAAMDDPTTGYALTTAQVNAPVQRGIASSQSVSTGRCA